jgi:hypothetical protein
MRILSTLAIAFVLTFILLLFATTEMDFVYKRF